MHACKLPSDSTVKYKDKPILGVMSYSASHSKVRAKFMTKLLLKSSLHYVAPLLNFVASW